MPRPSHAMVFSLAVLPVLVLSPGAVAQPAHLRPLIDRLGSESLAEREDATERIPRIPGLSVMQIEEALRSEGLTPEQRLRLNRIGERLFASTPRAGMGVRFSIETENSVTLAGVVDEGNFPAAKVLRAGDTFLEVDGHSPVTQDWLKAWIVSHAPGESLRVTLRRNGETLELDVPLGSFDDLGNGTNLDRDSISQAYRLRRSRLGASGAMIGENGEIGGSLDAGDWIRAAYPGHRYTTDPRPIAILSGHAVAGVSGAIGRAMNWGTRSLHLLHPLALTGNGFPAVLPEDLRLDMAGRLERQAESLDRRAEQLAELLDRREFTPEEVENITQQIAAARAQGETTRRMLGELEGVPGPENESDH